MARSIADKGVDFGSILVNRTTTGFTADVTIRLNDRREVTVPVTTAELTTVGTGAQRTTTRDLLALIHAFALAKWEAGNAD